MADRQSPPAAPDGQAQESQPQSVQSSDGPLRSIPTFKLEEEENSAGDNGTRDNEKEKAPSPSLIEKIMTKLGLTPIMLMCMFKSVSLFVR